MPLYDYGCKGCDNVWEVQHKIAEPGPEECPDCQSKEIWKMISPVMGKVELSGRDLKAKIKEDVRKIKSNMNSNENVMANMVGETKYNENQLMRDKLKKEIKGG